MIPDDRCVGGRQSVELELYSMRRKIVNVKSTLDNKLGDVHVRRIDPRQSPRAASPMRRSFDISTSETRETFRRVHEVLKRGTDKEGRTRGSLTMPPATYSLSTRLSSNRRKAKETTEATNPTHHNNVVHMYRRMEHMHSLVERKKNTTDAALYPAYIRRRVNKDHPSTLRAASGTSHDPPSRYSEYTDKKTYNIHSTAGPKKTIPKYRPASAPPLHGVRYTAPPQPHAQVEPLTQHLEEVYREFYSGLMEAIVAERMYQEGPLRKLFQEFIKNSAGEMEDVARRVVDDLKAELDVRD